MSRVTKLVNAILSCFNKLHSNVYLIISFYGILVIAFVALSTKWFFHVIKP